MKNNQNNIREPIRLCNTCCYNQSFEEWYKKLNKSDKIKALESLKNWTVEDVTKNRYTE